MSYQYRLFTDDLVAAEPTMEHVLSVIEGIKAGGQYAPKTILFVGGHGMGKTLAAKIVACETERSLSSMRGDFIVPKALEAIRFIPNITDEQVLSLKNNLVESSVITIATSVTKPVASSFFDEIVTFLPLGFAEVQRLIHREFGGQVEGVASWGNLAPADIVRACRATIRQSTIDKEPQFTQEMLEKELGRRL